MTTTEERLANLERELARAKRRRLRLSERLVLITALILFLATILYPPWASTRQSEGKQQVVFARIYAPIYAPPEPREPVKMRISASSSGGYSSRFSVSDYGVSLDFGRLALEWAALAAGSALALLVVFKAGPALGLLNETGK